MLITCEQVSDGHPDKICDQISDAIVTECLIHDKNSRVAVECMIKGYDVFIAGEVTSRHFPDYGALALTVLERIGLGDLEQYRMHIYISRQSPDIALGVDIGGAGDQGTVCGYATDETPELLPVPYVLATSVLQKLRSSHIDGLLPDAKCQATYDDRTEKITTLLLSTQHRDDMRLDEIRSIVLRIMKQSADMMCLNSDFEALINPTGRFVLGGSFADTGVTGRKIMCDMYGGIVGQGGALSGKDPTKVDRSAAYMARKIARDIVNDGLARRCEVSLSYAIGLVDPIAVSINCFGTNRIPISELLNLVFENYDLTPQGIIQTLHLTDVDYNTVSAFGHFGKPWLPWE